MWIYDKGKSPFQLFKEHLQYDDSYAWSWHCNIATMIQDEGVDYNLSNRLAAKIMKHSFNIDVTKFPEWGFIQYQIKQSLSIKGVK